MPVVNGQVGEALAGPGATPGSARTRPLGVVGAVGRLPGVLRSFMRAAESVLASVPVADGAGVELLDDGHLVLVSGTGTFASHVGVRVDTARSLSGTSLRTGRLTVADDIHVDSRADPRVAGAVDIRSLLIIPLADGDGVYGTMMLGAVRPGAFGDVERRRAEALRPVVGSLLASGAAYARRVAQLEDPTAAPSHPSAANGSPANGSAADRGSTAVGVAGPPATPGGPEPETDAEIVAAFLTDLSSTSIVARADAYRRIARLIDAGSFPMVFQPVVQLPSGRVVAVEALARFPGPPLRAPDQWFAEADAVGRGVELELAAARAACTHLDDIPDDVALALNFGPAALFSTGFVELAEAVGGRRPLVVELTEHLRVDDYARLRQLVGELRRRGVRLSIDDAGAGFSSMRHILELAPEFIKLDRELISNVDSDLVRRTMVEALVGFAHQSGIRVVAEGVEQPGELEALTKLGVDFAQGFLLRRPTDLPAALTVDPLPGTGI